MKAIVITAFAIVDAFLILLLVLLLTGCSWFKSEAKHAGSNIVDCTTSKAKSAIKEFAPTVEQLIVNTVDTMGRADWNMIEDTTKDFSADVGGCVLAATVAHLLEPIIPRNPDAPQAELLEINRGELAHQWDQLRLTRYGGALFKGAGP